MDEAKWLACTDADEMLRYLRWEAKIVRSPKGRRKLRLFACGCCRQVWQLIEDQRSRRLVEVSEQWAEGRADPRELAAAEVAARSAKSDADLASAGLLPTTATDTRKVGAAIHAALQTATKKSYDAARVAALSALCAVGGSWCIDEPNPAWDAQAKRQAVLLRCILGNPFRPLTMSPAWQTRAVLALATAAYDNPRLPAGTLEPDRLAVLANALEEAGCNNGNILAHLRGPGPHYRGCWAVDLILGRW